MAKRSRKKRSDLRVYLYDEVPRVGTGWRGVQLVKRGRVWVHLKETATGIAFKLPVGIFARMERCQ
jgi:hypothetical protein